ncbi:MAG: hypothetical protein ABR581_11490 [Thermoleophilaceae bacterium]
MDLELTPPPSSGPLQVVDPAALSSDEAAYVAAARAANTLRGYRSDWAEWCTWAAAQERYRHNSTSWRSLCGAGAPDKISCFNSVRAVSKR